ncbi:MAG: hypothetical protein LAO23_02655 [Acidobacteriia bacterium]|nr:hypothetical protein [Terriglobia bacterium]
MNSSARTAAECSDFLRKEAQTPLHEYFLVCGSPWEIWTNSESILEAARETFIPIDKPRASVEFAVRLWVDSEHAAGPPWPKPYVRGLDHLVFAGFDSGSSALLDLRTHRIAGRFSPQMGADCDYWKTVIFPIFLSIAGGSIGLAEIHSACVASGGDGLLLAGPSGSGKSTLSVALAQTGFGFLSDDRAVCALQNSKLFAWGMPTLVKLRRDAEEWLKGLREQQAAELQNEELVFRFRPERLGLPSVRQCEPRLIVFLERQQDSIFCMKPISADEAAHRIENELMAESPEALERQAQTINRLSQLACYRLAYGGRPPVVAERLARHFEQLTS